MTHLIIKLDPGVATVGKPAGGSDAQVKVSLFDLINDVQLSRLQI